MIQDNRRGDQIAAGVVAGRRDLVTLNECKVRGAVRGGRDPTTKPTASGHLNIHTEQVLLRQTSGPLRTDDDVSVPKNDPIR